MMKMDLKKIENMEKCARNSGKYERKWNKFYGNEC